MSLVNYSTREITCKIVYYGPGRSGKTTNLQYIHAFVPDERKGAMVSLATETDRTLFFDFMPMELGTIGGQKVRVQLYTVPGQVFYDATRKLVLRGADGVVFVADSQSSMRDSNIDSLENLKTNLRINRIDPEKVALVFQYNKRDLPNVDSVETMNEYLNPNGAPAIEASAITGMGVTATLRQAVGRILDNLKKNVDTTLHEEPELAPPDMSAKSGVTPMSAGTPKLSMKTTPAFDAEETVTVSPFEVEPIDVPVEEEDPFGVMAADDPFSASTTEIHDASAERMELQSLLASAEEVVRSLEQALERARAHEAALRAKL
jgi:signal recognition particle receptor subunit beta